MKTLFKVAKPIIGVIYLDALPGYPKHENLKKVMDNMLSDLKILQECSIDGILIENENDSPHTIKAPPEIISSMSVIAKEAVIQAEGRTPIGVEFLLNDPEASLAIANAAHAQFIRTDYFVDKMERPEYGGEMEINPQRLMEYRKKIKASNILLFTDIQVKYARMLEKKTIEQSVRDARTSGSNACVVSGNLTGNSPDLNELERAHKAAEGFPLFIGSGLNHENAPELLKLADGAIVGTSIMKDGRIDMEKTKRLMESVFKIRSTAT